MMPRLIWPPPTKARLPSSTMSILVDAGVVEELGSVEDVAGVRGIGIVIVVRHNSWQGLVSYVQYDCCQEDTAQSSAFHNHSSCAREESSHDMPHDEVFQLYSLPSMMLAAETACVEAVAHSAARCLRPPHRKHLPG